MNVTKFERFLSAARALNEWNVTPLLFGSLGLERRLTTDLQAEDIDILVPEVYLHDGWHDLVTLMEEMGYTLYDLHEHAFQKDGASVAFAAIESLKPFAGVDISKIPMEETGGAHFLLLDLRDYLRVYTASSKDGYRADKKHGKDTQKIQLLKSALNLVDTLDEPSYNKQR